MKTLRRTIMWLLAILIVAIGLSGWAAHYYWKNAATAYRLPLK